MPRYGQKQAGAEVGYDPRKPGRPNHHPIVAFPQETGDLVGLRWRPGSANTAAGAGKWIPELVRRLRAAGVEENAIQLDKGLFSKELPRRLDRLDVRFFLKVPNHRRLSDHRNSRGPNVRAEGILYSRVKIYSAAGELRGFRLVCRQGRQLYLYFHSPDGLLGTVRERIGQLRDRRQRRPRGSRAGSGVTSHGAGFRGDFFSHGPNLAAL